MNAHCQKCFTSGTRGKSCMKFLCSYSRFVDPFPSVPSVSSDFLTGNPVSWRTIRQADEKAKRKGRNELNRQTIQWKWTAEVSRYGFPSRFVSFRFDCSFSFPFPSSLLFFFLTFSKSSYRPSAEYIHSNQNDWQRSRKKKEKHIALEWILGKCKNICRNLHRVYFYITARMFPRLTLPVVLFFIRPLVKPLTDVLPGGNQN